MGIKETLRKLFENARETHDGFGRPIVRKTINEQLLESHLEKERLRKVKKDLDFFDKKHFREMTDRTMPHHAKFRRLRRRR